MACAPVSSSRPGRADRGLRRGRLLAVALALAASLICGGARAAPTDDIETAAIKAAFVYNFAKFASWPSHRFKTPTTPIQVCIQRHDLNIAAARQLESKQVGGRSLRITVVRPGDSIAGCHILFTSVVLVETGLDKLFADARQNSVLLVSDMPDFARAGGHIGLIEDRGRLRFQVNLSAAAQSGLKLSSKLLQLAEIVGPTPR